MKSIYLRIDGMTCEACARSVTKALENVPEVEGADVNYLEGRGRVRFADGGRLETVLSALEKAGYRAEETEAGGSLGTTGGGRARAGKGPDSSQGKGDPDAGGPGPDLLVIGSGSAGMAAAIRGAELGRTVTVVESGTLGGTCVNVGCIPSKNLIAAAEHMHRARSGFPGIGPTDPPVDWREVVEAKRKLVEELRQVKYRDVLDAYPQITLRRGRARFTSDGRGVEVDGARIRANRVVIATGTSPWSPPIPGLEDVEPLDSTTAMELEEVPESLVVLGGSAVGLELGQTFARFGSRVTVLELAPRLLPLEDADAASTAREALEAEGLRIETGAGTSRVVRDGGQVKLYVRLEDREEEIRADRILVATGRRANISDMNLEAAGIEVDERGFVQVDEGLRTSHPSVYAAGEVAGLPGFVYVAASAGRTAAANALEGMGETLDLRAVPRVVFTSPQVAAVGMNREEAEAQGHSVDTGTLDLAHLPRAAVEHERRGWLRVVAEEGSGRLLGFQAVAPNAAELLGAATLAVRKGLTVDDLTETLHPYLTWAEGLKLAAQTVSKDVSKLSCCA